MSPSIFLPLFLTLFPLTISPGPANLLLASSGSGFGARRTLPFWLGIYTVFALQALVVGAGLAELIFRIPALLIVFQYAGAAYLVYLAIHFFRASSLDPTEERSSQQLGYKEGAIMEVLNFKAFAAQAMMFSLFLDPALPRWTQVLVLSASITVLGATSGAIWMVAGGLLGRLWRSEQAARWQGIFFGVMLLAVAIWMVLRA